MKTYSLIAACCLLLAFQARTQSNAAIDSVLTLLPQQKDSTLCMSYCELTWLYRGVDRAKAMEYGEKAIEQAKKSNYPKGEAQAYNDLGIIYLDMQKMSEAKQLFRKSMAIRTKLKDDRGLAALHIKLGLLYNKEGFYDSSLQEGQAALACYEKLKDDFGIATALNNLGSVNTHVGNVEPALEYHRRALAIREKINDIPGQAASYVNVGNAYVLLSRYQEAIPFLIKAETLCRATNSWEFLASALNNLASCYYYLGNYTKALPYGEEAYELRMQLKDTRAQLISINMLGRIYAKNKKYTESAALISEGIAMADSMESSLQERVNLYEALAISYEGSGNFAKALEAERMRFKFLDSINVEGMNERFAEMETRYQTLQREQKIQEQNFLLTRKNYFIAGIAGLLVLGSLLAYSYYRRFRLKKEKELAEEVMHQQELATKAIVEAEENERRRIATELHDGVGQMMSAARMNLSAFETELKTLDEQGKNKFDKIVSLVDESCKEVRVVSHSMMPNALLKRGLAAAVRDFLDKLDSKIIKVNLYTEGLDNRLENNTESMLYRVIQECVSNVIKHSGANHLDISLVREAGDISLTIEDNGQGFDASRKEVFEGIGLRNIVSRVQYLKGNVDFDSAPGRGTVVAIHVPVPG